MSRPTDARRAATRARILEAATRLFSRYGVRRASVDEIARAASVAKPTLYTYFPNKSELFRAVCDSVLERIVEGARDAAATPGSVEERIVAVLAAKFTVLHELVATSPHAAELLGSSDRMAARAVEDADRRYAGVLAGVVEEGVRQRKIDPARADLGVPALVDILLRCGHGAGFHAASADAHRRQLAELVHVVLVGVARRR